MRAKKEMLRSLTRLIASYISCILPRRKNKIVYGSWFGNKYMDNPKYFFEYMNSEHSEYNSIWITRNKTVYNELINRGYQVRMSGTFRAIMDIVTSKYAVICCFRSDVSTAWLGGATILNTWHGLPLKHIGKDAEKYNRTPINKIYNTIREFPYRKEYYISTSQRVSDIYSNAFEVPKNRVKECGQARNDSLFEQNEGNYFAELIPIPFNNSKVITYMPTHRQEGKTKQSFHDLLDLERIQDLCEKYNYVFIAKKHYYHQKENETIKGFSRIFEITSLNADPQKMIASTDILITDYSSVYIDYLLLDRPIIFYAYDLDDYLKNERNLYFPYDEASPGEIVTKKENLIVAIEKAIINDEFSDDRHRVTDIFFDEKCRMNSCRNLFNLICELN